MSDYIVSLEDVGMADVEKVGGKNASLGEMITDLNDAGVRVPPGFATTAQAFRDFLKHKGLDQRIKERLASFEMNDIAELSKAGSEIREWVSDTPLSTRLQSEINQAYDTLVNGVSGEISVAVRSSATAEDLPQASFAGQQETFLNVSNRAGDAAH